VLALRGCKSGWPQQQPEVSTELEHEHSDTDSGYATPQQSLSNSMAVQLLQVQEEPRKLKEEIVRSEAQNNYLRKICNNAVAFMKELEEEVARKEVEKQEELKFSKTLLLRIQSQQACTDSTSNQTHEEVCKLRSKLGRATDGSYSRSQRVTEMLNSCSSMILPQGIPQQGMKTIKIDIFCVN
jgi:hypothetical protein